MHFLNDSSPVNPTNVIRRISRIPPVYLRVVYAICRYYYHDCVVLLIVRLELQIGKG